MTPKHALHAGFVLHQRPYRESSMIAEVFTHAMGRVACVARGVRTTRRKGGTGQLGAFRPYLFSWAGRGELLTLRHAEATAPAYCLKGDQLYAGLYANELLIRLCARFDSHPGLYTAYEALLKQLDSNEHPPDIALRFFERDLLSEVGYGLNLEYEAQTGNPIDAAMRYAYHPDSGAVNAPDTGDETLSLHGDTLLALAAGTLQTQQQRREARRLLRTVLDGVLGHRPLKSLQTLRRMQQMSHKSTENSD